MATKVFISWSGELSKQIAEAIRSWLPSVLQSVKPYYTPNDINKGSRWNTEIAHELEDSNIGIICLTKDNIEKPWILFEAGALSKNVGTSNVCPILFDFESTELTGPLLSFQATRFEKSDMKKMLKTINEACNESKLDTSVLDNVFEKWWPEIDEKIRGIIANYKPEQPSTKRTDRDILEEILSLSRLRLQETTLGSRNAQRKAFAKLLDTIDNIQFNLLDDIKEDDELFLHDMYEAVAGMCHALRCDLWFDKFMEERARLMR